MTVLGSLQLYGIADGWTWSDDAALGAGALEALVLSLGLADRSLALRRDRDHARRLADIDALTGLYNRRGWTDRVLALDEELRRDGASYSVLFLDLDRFKELNDRLGHEAGDAALRTLATVMREELREQDIIGRFGGEEFVVALPGADRLHATRVAERIRARLQALATRRSRRCDAHGQHRRRDAQRWRDDECAAQARRQGDVRGEGRGPQPRRARALTRTASETRRAIPRSSRR